MQARTKLLAMLMLVVALVIAGHQYWDFTPYGVAFLLVLCGVACSGISFREMARRLWLLIVIIALGTVLGLFTPVSARYSGRPLYILPALALSPAFLTSTVLVIVVLLTTYFLLALLPLPALRRPAFRRWLKRVKWAGVFVIFLLISLALPAISSSAHAGPRLALMITYDNLWYSGIFLAIFLTLYPCSLLLTMTTSPVAPIEGMTMLMTPLRWLRLPVDDFALMVLVALRFIPTLVEEIEQLTKAQAARGSSFSSGSLRERIQSVLALFVPFMRNTLRRASELATALDARGYQVDGRQTRLYEKRLALADYLVLLIVGGSLLAVLLI